jgi:hypothetical protein
MTMTMKWMEDFKAWLQQDNPSGTHRFFQITLLILGGVLAMGLGAALVAVILIASPLLTVLVLLALGIYGIASLARK